MRRIRKHLELYLMILPALAYFALFSVYPLIQGFLTSFQEIGLLGNARWVGLENYRRVFTDYAFGQVVANTLWLGFGMVATGVVVPLIVAVALHEVPFAPLRKLTQTITYTPHLFSWVVVGGIWIQVLSPDGGLANELIKMAGGNPIHFLANTFWVRPIFILLATWKEMGYMAVIYYAAISSLDPTHFEAATVDGAGRWDKIRHITLPQLVPTMLIVLVLSIVSTLRMFDQIFILRNAATTRVVDVLMTYVYDLGMAQFELGQATAASFMVVVIGLALITALRRLMRV